MRFKDFSGPELNPALLSIAQAQFQDEQSASRHFQSLSVLNGEQSLRADAMGHLLSQKLRLARQHTGGLDQLLAQYPLSSAAGRALMQLAEGTLRIQDHYQLDLFLHEQLRSANWHGHRGQSNSWLINWATLGLDWADHLSSAAAMPLIREAVKAGLHLLANQFIIAEQIETALTRQTGDFRYSFDMLGESAQHSAEAEEYTQRYLAAIDKVGEYSQGAGQFGPSVSVKLSALHAKFDLQHWPQIQTELYPRLLEIASRAKRYDIGMTIDAEESGRQLLTLQLFARLMQEPELLNWSGLGLAIQAYQKNAFLIVKWLCQFTKEHHRAISVRLVKGAYWDSEIKLAQQASLQNYPVWTEKAQTDQSYLACAYQLLQAKNRIYPQFATHNAFTLSAIHQMAAGHNFEFQALFGMGETLYQLANELGIDTPCRLYVPVGNTAQLLPYLVRRFLENGANTSFVHQIQHEEKPQTPPLKLPLPTRVFGPRNTNGFFNLAAYPQLLQLDEALIQQKKQQYIAKSIASINPHGNTLHIFNPADRRELVGECNESQFEDIEIAFSHAELAHPSWANTAVNERANLIVAVAQQLEAHCEPLIDLLIREAGKTRQNAQSELREAIDFCRYYAAQARQNWGQSPAVSVGIVIAISPWNFPLAIFVGQISSALLAGNVVIAKPAPETPLISAQAIACFHRAGVPHDVLQVLYGGAAIGGALCYDHRCHGVSFTGSLATARKIRSALAEFGADRALVAETGGINAMIVDSSAQRDQAMRDILTSAFDSAGQRCSALRLLCLQDTVADDYIARLKQCAAELILGNPQYLDTELGPVISDKAKNAINIAIHSYRRLGYAVHQPPLPKAAEFGHFVTPTLVELPTLAALGDEIFGPVLCIYRFKAQHLAELTKQLNQLGYGLTLGIHSRIEQHIEHIIENTQIGNYYINRNQIGAIVESQPFGGQQKSGTGPKAGGPWTLFAMTRNTDPCQPHYQALNPMFDKLQHIVRLWPDLDQSVDLEILFEDAARRSPLNVTLNLAGITGETNQLRYRGRGRIACLGPTEWDLVQQIGIAILLGNQAVIANKELYQQWQNIVGAKWICYAPEPLHVHIHAAMAHPDIAAKIELQLAQIDGAIIPLIQPFEDGKWPLFKLVSEYTVSRNTAASGGDVQLLSQ